jgi:hypothetical protein
LGAGPVLAQTRMWLKTPRNGLKIFQTTLQKLATFSA